MAFLENPAAWFRSTFYLGVEAEASNFGIQIVLFPIWERISQKMVVVEIAVDESLSTGGTCSKFFRTDYWQILSNCLSKWKEVYFGESISTRLDFDGNEFFWEIRTVASPQRINVETREKRFSASLICYKSSFPM